MVLPLFGDTPPRRHEFTIAVWDTHNEPHPVTLRAWDVDSSSSIAFSRAETLADIATVSWLLLEKSLCDDDGLPADYTWTPPGQGETADDDTDRPERDDRLDDEEQWSSRRRFTAILNDLDRRIRTDGLHELCRWLISETAARPTKPSSTSSSGEPPAGRGSTGTRRRKA